MVRTILDPLVVEGAFEIPPITQIVWTPGDAGSGNRYRLNGQQMVLARNNTPVEDYFSVIGATNATPIVVQTGASHGYTTGDRVIIAGVLGNLAANGTWVVTVTDGTHFSLDTSVGTGAYTSGGNAQLTHMFTLDVSTVDDPYGRSADTVGYEIEAGETHIIARLPITGFRQSDGYVYLDAEDSAIEFCVLDLSNQVTFTI